MRHDGGIVFNLYIAAFRSIGAWLINKLVVFIVASRASTRLKSTARNHPGLLLPSLGTWLASALNSGVGFEHRLWRWR